MLEIDFIPYLWFLGSPSPICRSAGGGQNVGSVVLDFVWESFESMERDNRGMIVSYLHLVKPPHAIGVSA